MMNRVTTRTGMVTVMKIEPGLLRDDLFFFPIINNLA